MLDMSKLLGSIKRYFSTDIKLKLIILLGLAGMALILISQFTGGDSKPDSSQINTATAEFTSEQYIAKMEEKLTGLITGIEGVGKAQVMVTLESGVEYIYAQEEKRNVDKTQDPGTAEAVGKTYQKENIEQKYILVDTNGKKQALVKTLLEPKIQGVVIVCEGGGDPLVQQNLTHVLTTALHIPSTRVCVVKITS